MMPKKKAFYALREGKKKATPKDGHAVEYCRKSLSPDKQDKCVNKDILCQKSAENIF